MRTIRIELQVQTDATNTIIVSTEVMIATDEEAEDAGRAAAAALTAFIEGYGNE